MAEFVNFYENIKEANMRLRGTVVLYAGEPYYVLTITGHKSDGIFRVYMSPTNRDASVHYPFPHEVVANYAGDHPSCGPKMDEWLENPANAGHGIVRKMMNSPQFNKFRPFPLGMMNCGASTLYLERQPTRKVEQGLTRYMITATFVDVSLTESAKGGASAPDIMSEEFAQCILGNYPNPSECLSNLLDPEITNTGAAFARHFAFVRGPLDSVYLAYKTDIVGVLPGCDFSQIRLGRNYHYAREAVSELGLFNSIING